MKTLLLVFAAASLSDALEEIGTKFEAERGTKVAFNFQASSTLARQIESGAPADLFFSADEEKMDQLQARDLIDKATRTSVLSNVLVLITGADQALISGPEDLRRPEIEHLALANPEAVPAGIYAKTYLEKAGLWQDVAARVVPQENVRAAMAAVASGNAEAAFVYQTDAASSKKVRVAFVVPPELTPSITYPIALLHGSQHADVARAFIKYLRSAEAAAIFTRHGFIVLP
jgi:molybdate transport system substrate-binding protein